MILSIIGKSKDDAVVVHAWFANFLHAHVHKYNGDYRKLRTHINEELHPWGACFGGDDNSDTLLVFRSDKHATMFLLRWA